MRKYIKRETIQNETSERRRRSKNAKIHKKGILNGIPKNVEIFEIREIIGEVR